ncbi:MAG: lamin tail domain-containing protein [Minisyncoccia bacterium]
MQKYFWIVCLFILPISSQAQVLISEVAWMGTDTDANNEWIELYNLDGSPTDLTGWTLSDGGSVLIALSGTLPSHGVGVLERTDDDTLPGAAFLIYSGALSNGGGTLILRNAEGGVSDEAVGGTDWSGIGGSNVVPKKTAQRTRTGTWVTALPTPNADNAEENATTTEENTNTTSDTTTTSTVRTSGSSGSSAAKKAIVVDNEPFTLSVVAPRSAYVNQEIEIEAVPKGLGKTIANSLSYTWNFGDTYTAEGKKSTHIFEYPGEYIVVAQAEFKKEKALARQEIIVHPVTLSVSRTENGDVVLKNNSKQEVDLGGFTLEGLGTFVFPKFTLLKAGGTLTISAKRISVRKENPVALYDVLGTLVVKDGTLPPLRNAALASLSTSHKVSSSSSEKVAASDDSPTKVVGSGSNEIQYIPIGQLAAEDSPAAQGSFKKFFTKVFAFLGL